MAVAVTSFLTLHFWGCATEPAVPLVKLSGSTMGTFYEVSVVGLTEGPDANSLQNEVEELLREINQQMSTYIADSEISRFNQAETTDWFAVSPGFAEVVAESLKIARESDGLFDPTVGPLVDLWNFGPADRELKLPTEQEIEQARAHVGYQKLAVRLDPPAIKKEIPALRLDLSAIAKGFGVDEIAALLKRHGYPDYLVNIGGEISAGGHRPGGQPWRLAVEKPVADRQEIQEVLHLADQAMATSGDYRNYYDIAGERFSHTIDPRTGRPVAHLLHSVSVIAPSCMRADGLATALLVMGPEAAWEFSQRAKVEVYLVYGEQEQLETRLTEGFPVQPAKGK